MVKNSITEEQIAQLSTYVREAGGALLSMWPGGVGGATGLSVTVKGDGSPVSVADEQSNGILLGALERLFPEDAVLSEESPIDEARLRNAQRVWVVDPLDGTRSFIEGRNDFSVLVALSENGAPSIGLMYFPAREVFVTSRKGAGAHLNGARMVVSKSDTCRKGGVYIRNFSARRSELASPAMDSGLAFLKVASGELDGAVIRMTTHREWDVAAPIVTIEEAGGRVTDESGRDITVGRGSLDCRYIITSNGRVHDELRELVRVSDEESHG